MKDKNTVKHQQIDKRNRKEQTHCSHHTDINTCKDNFMTFGFPWYKHLMKKLRKKESYLYRVHTGSNRFFA